MMTSIVFYICVKINTVWVSRLGGLQRLERGKRGGRALPVPDLPGSLSTMFNWRPGLAGGVLSRAVSTEWYGRAAVTLELLARELHTLLIAPEIKEDAMPCSLLLGEENKKGRRGEEEMRRLPAQCRGKTRP